MSGTCFYFLSVSAINKHIYIQLGLTFIREPILKKPVCKQELRPAFSYRITRKSLKEHQHQRLISQLAFTKIQKELN